MFNTKKQNIKDRRHDKDNIYQRVHTQETTHHGPKHQEKTADRGDRELDRETEERRKNGKYVRVR